MHTLRAKITVVFVACVLVALGALFVSDYLFTKELIDKNSDLSAQLSTLEIADDIDDKTRAVRQSTDTIYHYVEQQLSAGPSVLSDQKHIDAFLADCRNFALNQAEDTYGAISAYCVLNPHKYGTQQAFFITRLNPSGSFEDYEITDILRYDPDDVEHVGWYYQPISEGKPMWMKPYMNKNVGVWMISYVIPMYEADGTPIGVVGMDLNFDLIVDSISEMREYGENSFAFLLDSEGEFIFRKDFASEAIAKDEAGELDVFRAAVEKSSATQSAVDTTWNGGSYRVFAHGLSNNMTLAAVISRADMEAPLWAHMASVALIAFAITVAAVALIIIVARTVTKPLESLSRAATKVADGDLDVEIVATGGDEIEALGAAFQKMVSELRIRMDHMNLLAFVDSLTGLGSRAAYTSTVETLAPEIARGTADFTFVLLDVNYLKVANDEHGHDAGDALLQDAAEICLGVFGRGYAFRFGGDEFAVIVPGSMHVPESHWGDLVDTAVADFNTAQMAEDGSWMRPYQAPLSVAYGVVVFDPETHKSFNDVFEQADQRMYDCKDRQKSARV